MAYQLQLSQAQSAFDVVNIPQHVCEQGEVLIRIRAVAPNKVDRQQYLSGSLVSSWPAVLGVDGAGIVEALGPDVTGFKQGDEVIALFHFGSDNRSAAFQSHAVVNATRLCAKPALVSWAEAATIPSAYVAAATTICEALDVPLSRLTSQSESHQDDTAIRHRSFVLGGNSVVGCTVIQLLKAAFPRDYIATTIYGEDEELLSEEAIRLATLGANYAIDGAAPDLLGYSPFIGEPYDLIINATPDYAIGAELLRSLGGQDVTSISNVNDYLSTPRAAEDLMRQLGVLMLSGKYQAPLFPRRVEKGLERIGVSLAESTETTIGNMLAVLI